MPQLFTIYFNMLGGTIFKWVKLAHSLQKRLDQKSAQIRKAGQNDPFKKEGRQYSKKIWYLITVYILVIYASLPIMPDLVNLVENFSGRQYFGYSINTLLIFIVGALVFQASRIGFKRTLQVLIPMVVLFVGVLDLEVPAERIHFLEYGLLGFLVTKAIRKLNWKSISLALLFVLGIGAIDEVIQWLLPNRVGDLRDVIMNSVGGGMGIWVGSVLYRD